ncbi:hypothetical protein HYX06_03945 [Candidatus Woesearchaeota archaeon]|nr:hypothetical protein [Candidatus Woesearchaeota archaeon]
MTKKSQAALEFIMTYGWAILVVLVAIGALAYFGVLSPDKFLPAKCTMQAGLACIDHKATATSLKIIVKNSLGYDITVTDIKAQQCTAQTGLSISVANGGNLDTTASTCVNSGSKYNGQVNITFTTPSDYGGLSHTNAGQVTTRIE